jgi:hypothetical protein
MYNKIKPNCLLLFSVLFILLVQKAVSQPDPVNYGKIDKSLLEMKVFENDTTADAIVVCDYGNFDVNRFEFTRKYRLKVLKKSGCERANFSIRVQSKSDIRGITYNLVNGEIVKTKLKSESVFEEDMDKQYFIYKIAMPNVQVGSVIDIAASFQGIPGTWYFQRDIPVVWSEIRLHTGPEIGIQKSFFGFQKMSIVEDGRWVGKDMPALKQEPYINNLDNFLTKFELEFLYVNLPNYMYNFATSWEAVSHILLYKTTLGRELGTVFFMGDEAKSINDTSKTERGKVVAAYETIKQKIKWDNVESLFPRSYNSIKGVVKLGTGNSCEVNLALLLLLKRLNIEAYPVALSTRDNGMIVPSTPSLDRLNYLFVLAKINGQDILLDATEDFLPIGYLPQRCINGKGRIIVDEPSTQTPVISKNKSSSWVELKPGGMYKIKQYVSINLTEEGTLKGEIHDTRKEYAAYSFRKKYSEYNDKKDYEKEIERKSPGLKILNSEISDIDSIYKPISIAQSFEYNGNINYSDSTLAFNPMLFDRWDFNPFKLDERKMPVDFIVPFDYTYIYNYKTPPGYVTQAVPGAVNLTLPGNGGKFVFRATASDTSVQVFCNMAITKAVFDQNEYLNVKQFFAAIVKKESEPVVLKKKR